MSLKSICQSIRISRLKLMISFHQMHFSRWVGSEGFFFVSDVLFTSHDPRRDLFPTNPHWVQEHLLIYSFGGCTYDDIFSFFHSASANLTQQKRHQHLQLFAIVHSSHLSPATWDYPPPKKTKQTKNSNNSNNKQQQQKQNKPKCMIYNQVTLKSPVPLRSSNVKQW